jgi:hypothetical protein
VEGRAGLTDPKGFGGRRLRGGVANHENAEWTGCVCYWLAEQACRSMPPPCPGGRQQPSSSQMTGGAHRTITGEIAMRTHPFLSAVALLAAGAHLRLTVAAGSVFSLPTLWLFRVCVWRL